MSLLRAEKSTKQGLRVSPFGMELDTRCASPIVHSLLERKSDTNSSLTMTRKAIRSKVLTKCGVSGISGIPHLRNCLERLQKPVASSRWQPAISEFSPEDIRILPATIKLLVTQFFSYGERVLISTTAHAITQASSTQLRENCPQLDSLPQMNHSPRAPGHMESFLRSMVKLLTPSLMLLLLCAQGGALWKMSYETYLLLV